MTRATSESISRSIPDSSFIHQSLQPFVEEDIELDSTDYFRTDHRRYFNLFEVKMLRDHLFEIHDGDVNLFVDPIFDLQFGSDQQDVEIYGDSVNLVRNTRGIRVGGDIGEKVSFYSSVFENQAIFPEYLKDHIDSLQAIPGQSRTKVYKTYGFDFNFATGQIAVKVNDWFRVSAGHGKHKIGVGYRSLLLSDFAPNYGYIRGLFNTRNNKLRYFTMHAGMNSLNRLPLGEVPEALFEKKSMSTHFLNWMPSSNIEIGLFESTILQRWDTTGTLTLPIQTYIPIIGLNSATLANGNKHHVIAGINALFRVNSNIHLYGQAAVDPRMTNLPAYQAGVKFYDLLNINLDLQFEYNKSPEKMYAHSNPLENYTHMNLPLAHPLGANFEEIVGILNFRFKRYWIESKIMQQKHDWGGRGDISVPFDDIELYEPNKGTTFIADSQIGGLLNPKLHFHWLCGWRYRDLKDDLGHHVTSYVYVGLRTSLFNKYYDF